MLHLNTSPWLQLFLFLHIQSTTASPIPPTPTQQPPIRQIKSVELNPTHPTNDGASIQILKDTTESTPDQWEITPTDQTGFHLQLNLDETWAFHPIHRTQITLQIQTATTNLASLADSVTDSFPGHDLLFSFSYNDAHYVSSAVSIHTDSPPLWFPRCEANDDAVTQSLAAGNVQHIISDNTSSSSTASRLSRVMIIDDLNGERAPNNSSSSSSSAQFVLSKESESTFILDHYPNDSDFRFSLNEHGGCSFNASLHSLTVYIAALQIGSPVDILSISVQQEIWTQNLSTKSIDPSDPQSLIEDGLFGSGWSDWFGFGHWFLLVIYIVILMAATMTLLDKTHSKLSGQGQSGLCCCCRSGGVARRRCGCGESTLCRPADEMNSSSILLFGLAACNMMTVIYLSWKGCIYFIETESADLKILIIDLCSFIFIMIPYCINIVAMTKIHNLKTQSNGPRNWFERHFLFFAVLEFVSCDSYLSLKLVKSHIFGMDLFDSGHSSLDLKRIRATKMATICTQVCCHNVSLTLSVDVIECRFTEHLVF